MIDELRKEGFYPEDIIADGKLHRFNRDKDDKKKSAWYICFQNFTRKGEQFHVCVFGDWRDGSKNQYCSLSTISKEDRAFIDAKLKEAKKRREFEQEKVWEETALEAAAIWESASYAGHSDYLERKKVSGEGVKYSDGVMLVPVRDKEGKLWGLQRIFPNGDKFYMKALKVIGNFHLLGEIGPEMLLCEGYATGASLRAATGLPVLIAFQANNLTAVARQFPDISLTLCADDDKWKDKNAGREAAEKCPVSRVVFPEFKNEDTCPTDFNDLHILEGIEAVKAQVLEKEVRHNFVMPLGHKEKTYYYTSSSNRQIVGIDRASHTKTNLLDLMPLQYWEAMYPKKDGVDWDAATDALMSRAREAGIFDDNKVRGVGVWMDKGRKLINLGDQLFYDNRKHSLDSLKSNHVYEIGTRNREPVKEVLAIEERKKLISTLNLISWADPEFSKLVAGWLLIAPVAGALDWRPHIWITGGAGSGKSWIMQNLIHPMVRGWCHYFQGQTTEAGIRQTIKSDSKCLIFDEFETDDPKSSRRVLSILELIRQASSESEGHVAKGSPSGHAVYYRPRFAALVSSIRVSLIHEADRSRFTVIDLNRPSGGDQFDALKKAVNGLGNSYGDKLFATAYNGLSDIQKNIDTFWNLLKTTYSARVGQQYGALLGAWAYLEHGVISELDAFKACSKINFTEAIGEHTDRDEYECLDYLLQQTIRLAHSDDISFGEMIKQSAETFESGPGDYSAVLARYGIKAEKDFVWISTKHAMLAKLFKDTKWAGGWGKSMMRIEGVTMDQKYISGKRPRCVKLAISKIAENKEDLPF